MSSKSRTPGDRVLRSNAAVKRVRLFVDLFTYLFCVCVCDANEAKGLRFAASGYFGDVHGEEKQLSGLSERYLESQGAFISFKQMVECLTTARAVPVH